MTAIAIRPAEPAHLPELHRMLVALAAHHGDVATITPAELRRHLFQSPAVRALVACLADSPAPHPVGYALIVLRPDLVSGLVSAAINHLYVQPPFRKHGVGRALIAAARDLARAEGRADLVIGTHPANPGAAEAYRAMGLTELPPAGPRFAVALG